MSSLTGTAQQAIVKIINKDGTGAGTGFIVNTQGLFITSRHAIANTANIQEYRVLYNNKEYKFKRLPHYFSYSETEIDVLIFQLVLQSSDTVHFIKIKKLDCQSINGNCRIFGFPKDERKSINTETLNIYGYASSENKFQLTEKDILEGCSGSPIFLLDNDEPTNVIGIMSHTKTTDNKIINHVYSVNLIEKLITKNTSIDELLDYNYNNVTFKDGLKALAIYPPCLKTNWLVKYRKYLLPKTFKMIYILHRNIEHTFIQIEQDLTDIDNAFNNINFQNISNDEKEELIKKKKKQKKALLKKLLEKYKMALEVITQDVALHIKLVLRKEDGGIVLKAISRVESTREEKKGWTRYSDENFFVSDQLNIQQLKQLSEQNTNYRYNSAYNSSLVYKKRYWICNNLPKADSSNNYYSNSESYSKYYKSLAVFPISDKNLDDANREIRNLKGLLVIDSPVTGAFDKRYTKMLAGYLSHKLNRLLSSQHFNDFFKTSCNIQY